MPHRIDYQFKRINDRMKQRADAELQALDITLTQTRVLGFILEAGGQANQKEIERDLHVSQVSRMEQKGFLTSWVDPVDQRNKRICATAKAKEIDRLIRTKIHKQNAMLLQGLTPQQIEVLHTCLDQILENLEHD